MKALLRHIAFSAGFVLAADDLAAQQAASRQPDMRANSVYTEIGGNIGDFSFNYDRLIGKANVVRIGYGTLSDSYGEYFGFGLWEGSVDVSLVGFTVSRLVGRRHMAEIGVGGAFGTFTDKTSDPYLGSSSTKKETVNTLTATIGYRFQGSGRWLVRAGFTPSYVVQGDTENYPKYPLASMIGASFGFAF